MAPHDFQVFFFAALISALSGLGFLLRSPQPLTTRDIVSTLLNCGLLGLTGALLWYDENAKNAYQLIGWCGVAGFGGVKFVNLVSNGFTNLTKVYAKEKFGVDDFGEDAGAGKDP